MIYRYSTNIIATEKDINKLKKYALSGQDIFNPNKARFQKIIKQHSIRTKLINKLKELGFLDDRTVGTTVVLHSTDNCLMQQWHTDFDPVSTKKAETKPLGVLLALENDTYFNVYKKKRITMEKGDLLIFDGDTVHAGAAYTKNNTRIHMYLDSKFVKRQYNKTYLKL